MRTKEENEIHELLAEAWNKFLKLPNKPRPEAIQDMRRIIDQGHYLVAAQTCARIDTQYWTQPEPTTGDKPDLFNNTSSQHCMNPYDIPFTEFPAITEQKEMAFMDEMVPPLSDEEKSFVTSLEILAAQVHANAQKKGWWESERNDGELLCLVHAEVSEALEALRHGNPPSEHIPEFSGVEEELADVIIRLLDIASARGYRLGHAILAKIAFNSNRPYKHGKKF